MDLAHGLGADLTVAWQGGLCWCLIAGLVGRLGSIEVRRPGCKCDPCTPTKRPLSVPGMVEYRNNIISK